MKCGNVAAKNYAKRKTEVRKCKTNARKRRMLSKRFLGVSALAAEIPQKNLIGDKIDV